MEVTHRDAPIRMIGDIECQMASPPEVVIEQTIASLKRDLPEIEQLPEFKKPKFNEPFALAGGGPSIKYTYKELRNFRNIIACGSAHDWLIKHDIIPTYCIVLDPDRVCAAYLKHPHPNCNYLIASQCHPEVFDALKDYAVTRWHCAGMGPEWFAKAWTDAGIFDKEGKKPLIGGGCTCGLRAISIAILLGYKNLHFFGIDSNVDFNNEDHHAYEFEEPENEFLGDVLFMHLGHKETGRRFKVAKYMMAQLVGLRELIGKYGQYFDVTVHGDSITYEFMRLRKLIKDDKKLQEELELYRAKDVIEIQAPRKKPTKYINDEPQLPLE